MSGVSQAITDVEMGAVEVAEPDLRQRALPNQGDPAHDWLCAWCHQRVASEKDRLFREGQSEFSFQNPQGARFRIITFSQTFGCQRVGTPTLEHTWFTGYAWSYCLCDRCHMHLGWFYAGPSPFAGLIRDRIVRAAVVRN